MSDEDDGECEHTSAFEKFERECAPVAGTMVTISCGACGASIRAYYGEDFKPRSADEAQT